MSTETDQQDCERCHCTYGLREGCEPTRYCDQCAHKAAEELELENTRLAGEVERLTRERDETKQQLAEMTAARDRVVHMAIKQATARAFGS